jgi:hypothetical protein
MSNPLDGLGLLVDLVLEGTTNLVVWLFGALGVGFIAAGVWLFRTTEIVVFVPGLFLIVGVTIVAIPALVPELAEIG